MKQYRRRRGRLPYIPPLALVLLAALAAGAVWLLAGRSFGADTPAEPSTPPAVQQPDQQPPADSPEERVTTAAGVACGPVELGADALYAGELILVNNQTFYHFPQDQELSCIYQEKSDSYYVRDMEVYLSPAAMEPLNRMLDDFVAQGGSRTINVVAGYRTEAVQQHLFDQSAERNGLDHTKKYVAQPGGSEHHTGLAVDLSIYHRDGTSSDYDGTGEYAWINENCGRYGFVVRYEPGKEDKTGIYDEPWHFRYVGVAHAAAMAERGLCLEEYIDLLRDYPFDGEHLTIDCGAGSYEVWYCPGSTAYVPETGEYTVSGNNVDGLIVTCKIG